MFGRKWLCKFGWHNWVLVIVKNVLELKCSRCGLYDR